MRPSVERGRSELGVEEYLAAVGTTNKSSIETYLVLLGHAIERAPKPLLKLNPVEVRRLGAELKQKKSGYQYVRELRKFYKANQRTKLVEAVPVARANNNSTVSPNDILNVDEISEMLESAVQIRDRVLVVALYETGGRIAEVLSLNVEDLTRHENGGNDGRPWFKAWFRKVKEPGQEHYGYFKEAAAVKILDDWIASYPKEITVRPHPLLPSFSRGTDTQRLSYGGASLLLKTMARRAGIKKRMHPHVFKHTKATHLLRSGMNDSTVKKLLGWSPNSKMLARYEHLVNEDVERALGLSGEVGKPVEILIPQREVPAMIDLPFRTDPKKAVEMMRQEFEAKLSQAVEQALTKEYAERLIPQVFDGIAGDPRVLEVLDQWRKFSPKEKAAVVELIKKQATDRPSGR
jgi:site-specific recombinase XerD